MTREVPLTAGPSLFVRVGRTVRGGLETSPFMSATLMRERWVEAAGGHPPAIDLREPLREAIAWLGRAQDAVPGGIARGYGLAAIPGVGPAGWQAAYPETTGYIIPTLYAAAWAEDRIELARRATRAALWELKMQLPNGAIPGGIVGQGTAPAVFNTGQVIFGWLSALEEVGDPRFEVAARRAAQWLTDALDDDGVWRRGHSPFARPGLTRYNARAAWALVAAGMRLGEPGFTAAGATALQAVAGSQHANGWFGDCCLDDHRRPLTHTLAYTARGLLEGGVLLGDATLVDAAARAARALAAALRPDGILPGRFEADWRPAVAWSCLTGAAQMASVWMRLAEVQGDPGWLAPADAALRRLERTQNRTTPDTGLRGGIKGSFPITGAYGRLQTLSWATKFFVDAKLRRALAAGELLPGRTRECLALA